MSTRLVAISNLTVLLGFTLGRPVVEAGRQLRTVTALVERVLLALVIS